MKKLKSLGSKAATPSSPDVRTLEVFENPGVSSVMFKTEEFTSKCPVTGQPDFAEVVIEYNPRSFCLESKSLKLYLQSFRDEKAFIESLTTRIHSDIKEVLDPLFLSIKVTSVPRGGISLEAIKDSHRRYNEA